MDVEGLTHEVSNPLYHDGCAWVEAEAEGAAARKRARTRTLDALRAQSCAGAAATATADASGLPPPSCSAVGEVLCVWERDALRKAFRALDADGSGTLDAVELQLALRAMGYTAAEAEQRAAGLLGAADADGDGRLSFVELLRQPLHAGGGFSSCATVQPLLDVHAAFENVDANGDGRLRATELNTFLRGQGILVPPEGARQALLAAQPTERLDDDEEPYLTFREFVEALEKQALVVSMDDGRVLPIHFTDLFDVCSFLIDEGDAMRRSKSKLSERGAAWRRLTSLDRVALGFLERAIQRSHSRGAAKQWKHARWRDLKAGADADPPPANCPYDAAEAGEHEGDDARSGSLGGASCHSTASSVRSAHSLSAFGRPRNISDTLATRGRRARVSESARDLHVLSPKQVAEIRRLRKGVLLRALAIGAASGCATALCEYVSSVHIFDRDASLDPREMDRDDFWTHWAIMIVPAIVLTLIELLVIFRDVAAAVARMSLVIGLSLSPPDHGMRLFVTRAIAESVVGSCSSVEPCAAAPNIDPMYRLKSAQPGWKRSYAGTRIRLVKWWGVTKNGAFVVGAKLLLKAVLPRAAARSVAPFVAVPLTALFDFYAAAVALAGARVCLMGPFAACGVVDELLERARARGVCVTVAGREALIRGAACGVAQTEMLHPNVAIALSHLKHRLRCNTEAVDNPCSVKALYRLLAGKSALMASPEEGLLAVRLLAFVLVLDAGATLPRWRCLRRACDALGVAPSYGDFVAVRNAFLGGGLTAALLETRVPGRAEELMADDERRPASCWTAAARRWRGLAALVKFTFVP